MAQTRMVAVEMVRSGWILSVLKMESGEFARSLDVVGGGERGRVKVTPGICLSSWKDRADIT